MSYGMDIYLYVGSMVATYGSIGLFLMGRWLLSLIRLVKRTGGKKL
jgi:hypothetical protein